MNIIISGGTGLVGSHLADKLIEKGNSVYILTRTPKKYKNTAKKRYIDYNTLVIKSYFEKVNIHAVVNLAGAGIADHRWTSSYKKKLKESRINVTKTIVEAINKRIISPKVLISASAIGYYPPGESLHVETERSASNFLAEICSDWEIEAKKVKDTRLVIFRIGVVLSNKGGAFEKISKPVKMGVGAPLGSGNQLISWVHIDDLVNMIFFAIGKNNFHGVFNAVAPERTTNKELTKLMASEYKKPLWLPNVPSFVLKLMLGEMASQVLNSFNISSEKIEMSEFNYSYPEIEKAVKSLVRAE